MSKRSAAERRWAHESRAVSAPVGRGAPGSQGLQTGPRRTGATPRQASPAARAGPVGLGLRVAQPHRFSDTSSRVQSPLQIPIFHETLFHQLLCKPQPLSGRCSGHTLPWGCAPSHRQPGEEWGHKRSDVTRRGPVGSSDTHGCDGRLLPVPSGWVSDVGPQEDDGLLEHGRPAEGSPNA